MSDAPVFADGLDEIAQEFLVESYENLDELDRALVALEKEPNSRPLLASIFRTIHTIKGTSGFLAFNGLERVTHVGENVLSRLRDGHLELTPEIATVLLQMVDVVRALLGTIEQTGAEGDVDTAAVEAALARVLDPQAAPAEPEAAAPAPAEDAPVLDDTDAADGAADEVDGPAELLAKPDVEEETPVQQVLEKAPVAPAAPAPAAVEHVDAPAHPEEGEQRRSIADSSIRVDVGLLDQLMRMVGELVLTRNQVVQYTADLQNVELQRASQRLNLIASELQEGVMKTRMQPIEGVWSRLPRVVRDLGAQCGKQVKLVMEGRETELDRTLLEAVKDPLTHLVRNAVDHGLETPADRVAAGKPAEGTLTLKAYHESGQVVVEVSDDGRGMDPVRIGSKAVDNGLVSREQLGRMAEREVLDLIFRPGFSTAEQVTNVSGRGVGMDVVRTNIEKIGGSVDIQSVLGEGSTVRVRIPLTLAIIPALVVRQGGEMYCIPQVSLLELVRIEGESEGVGPQIEHVAGAPVHRLRGNLLPLVFLSEQLELARESREALNIVVLQSEGTQFGLVVEDVVDTQEIVVRPLSRQIKHVEGFAGATITGDGRVALILDIAGLSQRAKAVGGSLSAMSIEEQLSSEDWDANGLLVCRVGEDRRVALPMGDIARLEEFSDGDIEHAGDTQVVQYRGELMKLVHVGSLLGLAGQMHADRYSVVVHRHDGEQPLGFVVEEILDVIEQELQLSDVGTRGGLQGSAVLQGFVTDIVDIPALVAAARGGMYV
ncbi:MAG: chemotaxis protein CheW [Candidatus Nanopelagicales bacterium]|jgi:two-component system chemotaxis sensor kinase CheA